MQFIIIYFAETNIPYYFTQNSKLMIEKILFLSTFICFFAKTTKAQGVAVGATTPDASAMFEVRSTAKGLLIPRLTTTQRATITTPAIGLQIYNTTTNTLEFYNGTVWQSVTQSPWISDATGVYFNSGKVAIGVNGSNVYSSNAALTVNGAVDFTSSDSYQTVLRYRRNAETWEYQYNLGGPSSSFYGILGLSYQNSATTTGKFIWNSDNGTNNYMAIGSIGTNTPSVPKSRLHVFAGDVNIEQIGSGIIMKSPNGSCWRITIDNSGNLIRTAITCP